MKRLTLWTALCLLLAPAQSAVAEWRYFQSETAPTSQPELSMAQSSGSAAPAARYMALHLEQQEKFIDDALGEMPWGN